MELRALESSVMGRDSAEPAEPPNPPEPPEPPDPPDDPKQQHTSSPVTTPVLALPRLEAPQALRKSQYPPHACVQALVTPNTVCVHR
jgi:hypothetical protein